MLIDWDALKLTPEEATAIALMRVDVGSLRVIVAVVASIRELIVLASWGGYPRIATPFGSPLRRNRYRSYLTRWGLTGWHRGLLLHSSPARTNENATLWKI